MIRCSRIGRHTDAGRRGWMLIELMGTFSMMAVLTVCATQLIVLLMQAESRTEIDAARELAWQRLEDRLRDDAHQAVSAAVDPMEDGTPRLLLHRTGRPPVEFRLLARSVARVVAPNSALQEHDSFPVGEGIWRIEVQRRSIRLIHRGPGRMAEDTFPATVPPALRTTSIEAVLPSDEMVSIPGSTELNRTDRP